MRFFHTNLLSQLYLLLGLTLWPKITQAMEEFIRFTDYSPPSREANTGTQSRNLNRESLTSTKNSPSPQIPQPMGDILAEATTMCNTVLRYVYTIIYKLHTLDSYTSELKTILNRWCHSLSVTPPTFSQLSHEWEMLWAVISGKQCFPCSKPKDTWV